jgi:hypothetical protein
MKIQSFGKIRSHWLGFGMEYLWVDVIPIDAVDRFALILCFCVSTALLIMNLW